MSRFGIIVNVDKCVGCHACAIACKEENQVAPGIFYERVERFENIAANFINWFRVSCMHCDKPACMPDVRTRLPVRRSEIQCVW